MTKKTFLGVMVVALVAALAAGALYASNMGFKLNRSLVQGGASVPGGTSPSGKNSLALPDNRQSGLNSALDLMNDIGFANTQNVQRFLLSSELFQSYTGRRGTEGVYNLNAGEGYIVKMATTTNYIAVGSDNPTLAYTFVQGGTAVPGGTSPSGKNFYSYNYHQTAGDALALMNDIGFANTQNVQRFLQSSELFQSYTGRRGTELGWSTTPGDAYIIKMATTTNYTPSHY